MHGLAAHSNCKQPSERQPQQLMRHPTQLMDTKLCYSWQLLWLQWPNSNEHLEFLMSI